MGNVITHFMWEYQQHFRISKEVEAERIFRRIDKRLKPEVFIVGILAESASQKFSACVEPEDDFWIQSEDFDGVTAIANRLVKTYPEAGMFQSHPLAQEWQDEDLLKRSIRDAVSQIIESHASKPPEMSFRVSYPARVDSYWVCVVLGLQTSVLCAHPSLRKSSVKMHEHRSVPVAVSFIDAAVDAFLSKATGDLLHPNPGLGLSAKDPEELLRSAGDDFMRGLVWRIDQNCIEGMEHLFRSLTTISSLRYEKAAGAGRLLIGRRKHPSVVERISFATPTPLGAYRSVRKLVELASDDFPLYCDPEQVYGLAEAKNYQVEDEDLFEVQILEHHHWELRHAGDVIMRVKYGLPSLPKLLFDENKLRADLPRMFRNITAPDIDRLVSLAKVAEEESHGTMLVITEAAASEAARLAPQGTPVGPFLLTTETLKHLTSIDGAIILSPTGVCYAIGIILDGNATRNGDPGRGARFNSAIRYYESTDDACLVIVVSSDGGVDFVPNLHPAIRRSAVDEAITTISAFKNAEKLNKRLYRATLDWLDEHRFYLKEQDCETLNPLVTVIEERIRREGELTVWIMRQPFTPNPAMDDTLYYLAE